MELRRVVITGLGTVTSIGVGSKAFGESLRRGANGVTKFRAQNALGFPFDQGGEVHHFDPRRWVRRHDPEQIGRSSQFAIAAARQAIEDAGLTPEALSAGRCSVSIGTTDGESQAVDLMVKLLVDRGAHEVPPALVKMVPADRLATSVAREFELDGEAVTISTACAAGNYAIGNAFDLIRTGEVDFVLGGGTESIARKSLAGFFRLGAIAKVACQPFDAGRQGIIAGEGAGVLLLESLDSARARGARIYAEILGCGLSCDAKHSTSPDPMSIAECMRKAHANAGISPRDVDYICAHGTGTSVNDAVEAKAIREVFGDSPPPTSSIKSMIGHTMGAASALGVVACALAVKEGFLPPTINFQQPDPECTFDCVPNAARAANPRIVQNNGFAFGGNNAIIILGAAA
jgi:3-oxoacyl-[acyl-carrier-protein] synthase II